MPVTFDGRSADAGHFRLRRLNKKTRKSFVERFAALTREEREKKPVRGIEASVLVQRCL